MVLLLQITRGIQPQIIQKNLKPNIIIYTANKKFNLPDKLQRYKAITYPDIRQG